MVFGTVHTPRPTSKGLDHPISMSMLACFYTLCLCYPLLCFAMLDTLRGLDLVWLHPMPMRPCLDVTIWEASSNAGLLCTYPSFFA